ncbi:hypothetical protein [Alienimonas chondri]|uniref:Uncharacterized protein n=1 Tax=Alienimonas chondri TaxID=2681879 RepID=A0ABX1VCA3_9PLAN|nr:hypothetical protein [Alienimonas chondri]NNJ24676.1 hypothetical protein [Alienimonas chondri]
MPPETTAELSADPIAPADGAAKFGQAELKAIFLSWERLRIVFNLVLAGLCSPLALLCGPETYAAPAFWGNVFAGVLLVNVLFFAGPAVESYLDWLGLRHRAIRWGLFLLGLLPTMAYAALSVLVFPTQIGPL